MTRLLSYLICFHDKYYPENVKEFTTEEIHRLFIWYSVSPEPIQSEAVVPVLLRERFLCDYDGGKMQAEHWYQNSALFHLSRNPYILSESAYVGFGQYDFYLRKDGFEIVADICKGTDDVGIGFLTYPLQCLFDVVSREAWDTLFCSRYNDLHDTKHSMIFGLWHEPILCHAFTVPTWFFMEMMEFMDAMTTELQTLSTGERHIAGTIERALAIYLNFAFSEGRLRRYIVEGAVVHNEKQRCADPFRGISATPQNAQEFQDYHDESEV